MPAVILFIFSILISSFSQILLKKGSKSKNIYLNKNTILGYTIMIVATFFTVMAYKKINLSFGVLLESLSYIFVPFLSYLFLHEQIRKKTILGMFIIIFGIIIFSL